MLHITNGSSVALDRSGIGGEIVFWVDVLHEGPVPAGLELEELSRIRAARLSLICMGDCTLFCHLRRLVDCPAPLLEEKDGYRVTEADRKSTRLNSSHLGTSYAVFC